MSATMIFGLHANSVYFAATSFVFGLLGSVYHFSIVKVFLNRYHISESSFQTAQVLYMIWNAVNDPLFAYLQDTSELKYFKSRRHAILYAAPVWSLAFLVPWFPWGENGSWLVGLHLFAALSFYDTALTFVGLAFCALFAELSSKQEDRLRLVRYNQWASMLGCCSVMVVVRVSDNLTNYGYFQICMIVIAFIAFFALRFSGANMRTRYDETEQINKTSSLPPDEDKRDATLINDNENRQGYFKQTWQILSNRNFLAFVFTNFCQELQRAICSGFTAIIGDALIPESMLPSYLRVAWYGATFILPQVVTLLASGSVGRFGYFRVIRMSYVYKVVAGLTMYLIGFNQPWKLYLMIVFMISDTVVTFATFHFFAMPLSDIVDADTKKYNRSRPRSSMVFGTNALIVKPAQSISPMIAVAILNAHGYEKYKLGGLTDESELSSLYSSMFFIICFVPLFLGSIQYCIWSQYQIRDTHEVVAKYSEGQELHC